MLQYTLFQGKKTLDFGMSTAFGHFQLYSDAFVVEVLKITCSTV